MQNVRDHDILQLYEQRNEAAITETISRYGVLCRTVAKNILGSNEDAEECLNDALMSAWNAIPPAKPQNFCAYLMKLVRNQACNRWSARTAEKRGGGQMTEALDELAECVAGDDNVEQSIDRKLVLEAITRFLGELPAEQRQLFVRRYWHASSIEDLASDFDMTENHVYVSLSRIRKRLEKYLRKEGLL